MYVVLSYHSTFIGTPYSFGHLYDALSMPEHLIHPQPFCYCFMHAIEWL